MILSSGTLGREPVDRAPADAHELGELTAGRVECLADRLGVPGEHGARLGQADAAARTHHERHPEALLGTAQVLAHGGLAVSQRAGGCADRAVLGDRPHDAHGLQIQVHCITVSNG